MLKQTRELSCVQFPHIASGSMSCGIMLPSGANEVLRNKASVQFTQSTRILFYFSLAMSALHIPYQPTQNRSTWRPSKNPAPANNALSHGIYHNWNSYPIFYQLFHLCHFCPWVNFALHWFSSSWVICSNLCLITPPFDWWGAVASYAFWSLSKYNTGATVRREFTSRHLKRLPLVSAPSEIQSQCPWPVKCASCGRRGRPGGVFLRSMNVKHNLTNALCCLFFFFISFMEA